MKSSSTSVKRSSDSEIYSSRFDKKYEGSSTIPSSSGSFSSFQPIVQLDLSKGRISKVSTENVADWQVCKTPEGVEYYYNQRTRNKTYEKPDCLKSEAELSLKVCPSLLLILVFVLISSHVPGRNTRLPKVVRIGIIRNRVFLSGMNLLNTNDIKKSLPDCKELHVCSCDGEGYDQ